MTIEDLIAKWEEITLVNPPFEIGLRSSLRPTGRGDVEVRFSARAVVPCRDTGAMIEVVHVKNMGEWEVRRINPGQAARFFEGFLHGIFVHEFEECFHVKGKRIRDPHA